MLTFIWNFTFVEEKNKNTSFQERRKCESTEAVRAGKYSASFQNDLVMTNWKKHFAKKSAHLIKLYILLFTLFH